MDKQKAAETAEHAKPKKIPANKKPSSKLTKPNRPKSKNPKGRPKISQDIRDTVLKFLREGNSKKDSCYAAGVTPATFFDWAAKSADFKEKGIKNDYTDFTDQVEIAQAEARRYALSCWQKQLPTDWRASVTYLERTDPENWAPKQKIDITSNGQTVGPMIVPLKDRE